MKHFKNVNGFHCVDEPFNYYTCPHCGQGFDPKEADVEYPDVYLECECGYDLAFNFGNDILELWMSKQTDRLEGDR